MGNTQAKEPHFNPGVEVTPGLLARLEGKAYKRTNLLANEPCLLSALLQAAGQGAAWRCRTPALEEEALKLLQRDQELRLAYEKSRIAGELLLKNESGELDRIRKYADKLLKSEYRAPSGPVPCTSEHDNVLECYLSHAQDPLACASFVDAYAACAGNARKEFAGSRSKK